MDSGLVLGVDGDYFSTNAKDTSSTSFDTAGINFNVEPTGKENLQSTWAVRGRLGWPMGSFMPYLTGGFAGAALKTSVRGNVYDGDSLLSSNKISKTKSYTGWTIGAGMEWMVTPSWVLRLDYQYKDLGKKDSLSSSGTGTIPGWGGYDYAITSRTAYGLFVNPPGIFNHSSRLAL